MPQVPWRLLGVAALAGAVALPSPARGAVTDPHVIVSYTYVMGDRDCKSTPVCTVTPDLVARGDTLQFVNLDSTITFHTVTSDDPGQFDSGLIGVGAQTVGTIATDGLVPGVYGYHCVLHPWMRGSFTVT